MRAFVTCIIVAVFILGFSSGCKKDESGDQNKPFIILTPPNPLNWGLDVPYQDPGATAYDITESGDTIFLRTLEHSWFRTMFHLWMG